MKSILAYPRRYPSKVVIWLSLAIIMSLNLNYENWNNQNKIIAWDVNSYYAYLPVVFIHKDIDMNFRSQDHEKYGKHYWPVVTPKGKVAIVTSAGLSYMYMPFFLSAHAYVKMTDYAGDEFSPPYKIALILSCLFYFTIGLLFLRKVLRRYYSEWVTTITLLIIVFGTNLLHYTTEEPTMSHAYSFSLVSVFIFFLIKWFEKPNVKYALLTGALAGLITLIRPSNVLIILLFIFWGVTSFRELGQRFIFYLKKYSLVFLMVAAFILIWVPQFIYWYYVSGSIFYNAYASRGAGFFFDQPQIFYTLFSYRKGWFVYTPMMFLAIIGLYMLYKQHRQLFLPVTIYLILNVYIISSWWCWWYGGGFGQRSFIDFYPIMALPLAAFVFSVLRLSNIFKLPTLILLGALIYVNIFQVTQFRKKIIHHMAMTKDTYWHIFLNMKPYQVYWDNLVFPDYNAAEQGIYYPITEIPFKLEGQLKMRGWVYLNKLRDSISNQPELIEEIVKQNKDGASLDSLIDVKATAIFKEIVDSYYKDNN